MKIIYGKSLTAKQNKAVSYIASECGILFDTARLLFYRGIDTLDKAKAFLNPGKSGFIDPLLLNDMENAVKRIIKAKDNREKVLIFGDYDADGVCATTILYYCLKEFGIIADCFVPERDEGYGLNLNTIEKLREQKGVDLLITVDCGISSADIIEELKNKGVDVIVTDHHEPPDILPNCIKINPKIAGQKYPFTELCGAGVAYKLGSALIGDGADKYLDFVALATVADSMDLVGENRDLVVEGLKLFNNPYQLRSQFKNLLGDTNKQVTAQTLAYVIAPRVNAGGRMGDANSVLTLFTTNDQNEIFDLSAKLCSYNIARQVECDNIYKQAKEKIKRNGLENDGVILVADNAWRVGFVGIVAAKLVEEYNRPVIVFAGHDGYLKGSARSVEGLNIYEVIAQVKDLLIAYGGHSQAAGVAVKEENYTALSKALNERVKNLTSDIDLEQPILVEWNVTSPINMRFAREIDALEPFGVGNRKPLFTTEVEVINSLPLKSGSAHYSFKTEVLDMLDFNGEKNVFPLSLPVSKKVVFEINRSVYKNRESIKGIVRSVHPNYGDFSAIELNIFHNEVKKLSLDFSAGDIKIIKEEDVVKSANTLYVITDAKNLECYPQLKGLPLNVFSLNSGNLSQIVISPIEIPEGFDKVVYLDKPMQVMSCDSEIFVVDDRIGYRNLDKISVDRSDFARNFSTLRNLSGKEYKNAVSFCSKYFDKEERLQTLFTIQVFMELGIFKVNNGRFTFDEKVKNTLTNSRVYSKIYTLKDLYD